MTDLTARALRQIDTFDLEVVLAVAEAGSFRQAAERLHLGQSAVSRRVQKLENLLGVSLFERRSTGARLTYSGSEFVACSSAIFENLKAALIRAQSAGVADVGKLRIGSMASFSSGPQRKLIQIFAAQHPDVDLHFVETERCQMMTMLSHRTLDVVISVGEHQDEYGDSLILTRASVYLAVRTDSRWVRSKCVKWSDLMDETFLISARESGPDIYDYIVRRATGFGKSISVVQHQISRDGIMNLVGLGFGVTVVGDHAAGAQYPNVTLVPLGGDHERVPFSITWRPENDNPALRRFISLARIEAKENGALS